MTQQITLHPENFIEADERAIGFASVYAIDPIPGPSSHIESQFPEFVSEDHPTFIELMKLYYKWMESYRNVLHDTHRITQYQDIDESIDEFTEQFFKEFLVQIPRTIIVDKKILLKNIKQFYRAKGTEKSYKLFFRMLYNASVSFYYPRVDILKASDGKWVQNKTIKIRLKSGSIKSLEGSRIIGIDSGSTAYVERIFVIQEGPITGYELVLNRSSLNGIFRGGETITTENNSAQATVSYIPVEIKFRSTGKGYKTNETITLESGEGRGASIRITSVDDSGAILEVNIDNYGIAYDPSNPIVNKTFSSTNATQLAHFDVILGATTNYPGYYMNEDGQLSSSKFIHDGEFYQQFSYVTLVSESTATYKDLLFRTLHPAGFKFYGGFSSQTLIPAKTVTPKETFELTIKHQLFPYIQSPLTGTVTLTQNGTQIIGNETQFQLELKVGDILVHPLTQEYRKIVAIASDSSLMIDFPFGAKLEKNVVLLKHNGTDRHYPKTQYVDGGTVKQYNFFSPALNARTTVRSQTALQMSSIRSIESQQFVFKASATLGTYVLNITDGNPSSIKIGMSVYGDGIELGTKVVQKLSNFLMLLSLPVNKSLINSSITILKDGSYALGAAYASICRHKFQFKPVAWYDENVRMLGDNQTYYGDRNNLATNKAQTPISVFDQLFGKIVAVPGYPDGKLVTPFVMESNPKLGTNLMPDAVVTQVHKDRDPNDPASRLDPVTIASLESFGEITITE